MLYKINIHHEDGHCEDAYADNFIRAERLVKEDEWTHMAWITEFVLKDELFEPTNNAWKYTKSENGFHCTEHKEVG